MNDLTDRLVATFRNADVLIIGGTGFLGSNLGKTLCEFGARVTLFGLDGKRSAAISDFSDRVNLVEGDVRDPESLDEVVRGKTYIFNLAASSSYIDSARNPVHDLEINCMGHLHVLEAVRKNNPEAKMLFSSSRMVYGKLLTNPVSENHPTDPLSIYGAHKLTAEKYYTLYHKLHGLNTVIARIPNPYGPRQHIKDMRHGAIVGWVMKELMDGHEVKIFGDGSQKRNYVYVVDLVTSFLLLISNPAAVNGEAFNVGTDEIRTFKEMVETVRDVVQNGSYRLVPWPKDFEQNETGDYVPDLTKLERTTGYRPTISLRTGVERMLEFYTNSRNLYW